MTRRTGGIIPLTLHSTPRLPLFEPFGFSRPLKTERSAVPDASRLEAERFAARGEKAGMFRKRSGSVRFPMSVLHKPARAINREWTVFVATVRSAAFRELLLWCLPALILGAIARAMLNFHFPYGYFQADSPDFLVTAERLIKHHTLVIHGKKAFLAPILFTIPFLLHIPALIVIPIFQHLAGLAATVAAGALVRCWFRLWRWFIIPITTLYTLNPALLWYEQALLAECHYLFCVTALAKRPGRRPSARLPASSHRAPP